MYIEHSTLDDLLHDVFELLLKSKNHIKPSKGWNREQTGVLLGLTNPRARLSRTEKRGKLFSSIGELLWYLSKDNSLSFIQYYIDDYKKYAEVNGTIHGGYGPRLFDMRGKYNQIQRVITLLGNKPSSRKAVIQLFDASDLEKPYKDVPCTCTLQFAVRDNRLEMFTSMRSNDAFWGLPHDIFAFTMLQELIARSLGVELGIYKHFAASLHLYDLHRKNARIYLKEGFQSTTNTMPPIPLGDPWKSIEILITIEERIRHGADIDIDQLDLDPFWKDIVVLLQIFSSVKRKTPENINALQKNFSSKLYDIYANRKQVTLTSLDKINKTASI
jgi:thymidylate synthase